MPLAFAPRPSSPRDLGARFRWGLALLGLFFSTTGALCSPDDAPPPSVCGGVPCLEPCNRPPTTPAALGYLGAPGETGCSPDFRCIIEPDQTAGQCWNKQDLCLPDTYITVSQETFVSSADCGAGLLCRVNGANAWFGRCTAAPGGAGGSGGSGGASGGAGEGGEGGAGGSTIAPADLCEGSLPDTLVHTPGAAVDYVVNCRIKLTSATSVQPGVVIGFTSSGALELRGASLVGTAEAPIRLIPQDNDQPWRGVEVFGAEGSSLERVIVSKAGAASPDFSVGAALRVGAANFDQGTVSIRDCVFEASAGVGISFGAGSTAWLLENSSIKGSKSFPIEATPEALSGLDGGGNLFSANGIEALRVFSSGEEKGATWHRLPIPYRIDSMLQLQGSHFIDQGVIVEMAKDSGITLVTTTAGVASLSGKGLTTDPVEFRGTDDAPGSWSGFLLLGANLNLKHARISGGGAFPDAKPAGMILVDPNSDGSTVSIRDCVLENSSSYAIVLNGAQANSDISTANTFTNNGLGDVAP